MKIAALVSGGVDSAVALRLLKDQGHDVTAFYLKIWLEDELSHLGDCPWQEDLAYVEQVCAQAGVPLKVVSLQKEYHQRVVADTIAQVKQGMTPNPDMLCNRRIKFGVFYDRFGKDFDAVATGHYAQVVQQGDRFLLKMAPDEVKDQTYFLSQLTQEQLARVMFPIGHLDKAEVRRRAHAFDLPNKDRKDSQGICFLGKFKFNDFLRHHLGQYPGDLIEYETDEVIGTHNGYWYHTIGQRRGLNLGGGPWFVVSKDIKKNIVYISRNYYTDDKKRDTFSLQSVNWFAGAVPATQRLKVKLRHGPELHDATIVPAIDGSVAVSLMDNDQGIAAGQYAVFYDGDTCLGGGVMSPQLKGSTHAHW